MRTVNAQGVNLQTAVVWPIWNVGCSVAISTRVWSRVRVDSRGTEEFLGPPEDFRLACA